jgi:hypothetical protein
VPPVMSSGHSPWPSHFHPDKGTPQLPSHQLLTLYT